MAARAPLATARTFIGREIKLRVAPTICMVLMRNRLLYIASLIVLSINTIERIENIPASTINPIRMYCIVGPIFSTREAGYFTVSTIISWRSRSALIEARLSFCTYWLRVLKSIEVGKGFSSNNGSKSLSPWSSHHSCWTSFDDRWKV